MKELLRITYLIIIGLIGFPNLILSQDIIEKRPGRDRFVKNLMSDMSTREKIGQLIIIGTDTDKAFFNKTNKTLDSLKLGGICFFKGDDKVLIEMSRKFSQTSKIPLFFAIDAEWGLGMRLNQGYSFPRQISIGASSDDKGLYLMGKNLAMQCREMGININFAPTIDINTNPLNPVIGFRSFGEDKYRVAEKGWQYTKGMQDNGLLPTIKHFPGHGDTEHDSHLLLPKINLSKTSIDTLHAMPFKYSIDKGAWAIMVGHLNIPSITNNKNIPSSLSKEVIKDYLIDELGFKGLVFTDALNMKGITSDYKNGEAELMAIKAGVDILLMPNDAYKAIDAIMLGLDSGDIDLDLIEDKCKKVLRWKYDLGLFEDKRSINIPSTKTINNSIEVSDKLSEGIITFLGNNPNILPLDSKDKNKLVLIEIGKTRSDSLKNLFLSHRKIDYYYLDESIKLDSLYSLFTIMDSASNIIISISSSISSSIKSNYGISYNTLNRLDTLQKRYNNVLVLMFTNPYALASIDSLSNIGGVLMAYQNDYYIEKRAVESLFGESYIRGRLPVGISPKYQLGGGIIKENKSLGYDNLIAKGMDVECFIKIDSIANNGIRERAYPGCQIIVIKSGDIVYNKNYGYLTYDSIDRVNDSTLYDIASLTKVIGTNLAIMKLYEEGKIDLDDKISDHLPVLKKTNKKKITIKQALSHNARLKSWSPFWKDYLDKEISYPRDNKYKKEIIAKIIKSDLNKNHAYVYSDFGFILLSEMVENITNKSLDKYLDENFYKPLGLETMCFNPLDKIPENRIAPTENDVYFRKKLVRGSVHDQTSYLMGGIAGHAGLFSNAKDLAVILDLLLQKGEYAGEIYLKPSTIEVFTSRHYKNEKNRRALGFDKPLINGKSSHCSNYVSDNSYGHSGFTGTYFWSDPNSDLSFIFLSNRVYPNTSPNLLSNMNIRTNINDLIYLSIINSISEENNKSNNKSNDK